MKTIKTVKLENVKFYAKHGLYPQEQKTGNHFIVNISVSQTTHKPLTENIEETIDYATLHNIITRAMEQRADLLEAILQRIIDALEKQVGDIHSLSIELKKRSPAFDGNCGASAVQVQKYYHQ